MHIPILHTKGRAVLRIGAALFLSTILSTASLRATEPAWEFKPQRFGAALVEGGWMAGRTLDVVNGSPEFTFPVQLVYLSSRTQSGRFGPQWFSPQLESRVLPRDRGVLAWTTPAGGVTGLFSQGGRVNEFASADGEWQAKMNGALITISNTAGWRYLYRSGRLISAQSPGGLETDYAYTGSNLTGVSLRDPATGAARPLVAITAQADGRITGLTVCGHRHEFTYENGPDGRLLACKKQEAAAPDTFSYGKPGGVLAAVQPARGERTVFTTRFVPPADKAREAEARRNPASYQLVDDGAFRYGYNGQQGGAQAGSGQITLEDRAGRRQSMSFAMNRGVETFRDGDGRETKTYYYRAPGQKHDGKLRRIEQEGVALVDNRYDRSTGNLLESRDRDGVITFYEYEQPPRGAKSGPQHSKPARILRGSRKARELVAAMKHDAAGRLLEQTDAAGQTTKYSYNAKGALETVTDPAGLRSTLSYDAFGRISGISRADQRQSAEYDDNGRVKARRMPDGQAAEFSYDAQGNLLAAKQNGVIVAAYERDENGGVLAQLDALNRRTWFERDAKGRLLAEHQPNGAVTRYEYDTQGRRAAQIDADNNRITFKYDAAGRMIEQRNPLGQTLTWKYDAKGRLAGRTNGVQTISHTYNDKDQLALIDYGAPGEKVAYRYDEKGRIGKVSTPTNSIAFFYDAAGRVAAKQLTRGQASERVIRYTYTARGQKASVVLSEKEAPNAGGEKAAAFRLLQQTEYAYDTPGRLLEIKSNGATVCSFRYDAKGRLAERTYGNGITGRYTYDAFGRQSRLDLSGGPLLEPLALVYEWDAAGQLKSRAWNGETQVYEYDPSGQLLTVSALAPAAAEAGGLQPVSNPSQAAARRLKALESYKYDPAGNMLEKFEEGLKTTMTYDAANQLRSSAGSDGAAVRFDYDKAGRLAAETSSGSKTRQYGFLDKVLVLTRPDGTRLGYDYYPDGQLAAKGPLAKSGSPSESDAGAQQSASGFGLLRQLVTLKAGDEENLPLSNTQKALEVAEEFVWDDLALLYRNGTTFAIEPHVSGGAPIAAARGGQGSAQTYYLNDILGTTLAVITPEKVEIIPLTAFGRPRAARPNAALKAEPPKLSMEK